MIVNSRNLKIHERNKTVYFTFPRFDMYPFITHAFSSRIGGVSEGYFESMNLNFSTGDKRENVIENYKILCNALNIEFNNLVLSSQTHGAEIRCVNEGDKGKGIVKERDDDGIDGLVTNIPNIPLVTLYADCVPIFFADPRNKTVGLAHAGWKGTVKGIGKRMIDRFVSVYNSKREDILVGIGPSIGKCCYEVEIDVVSELFRMGASGDHIQDKDKGKYMIDLWAINKDILIEAGIKESNITVTDICTKCHKDILFSHRGHMGKRGGMAAIIQLTE